jgi:septal ring factor EnvC (AmiA/AmiB activator)
LKTSLFKETEVRELDGEISRLKEQLVATKIELRQIRNKASVYQAKLRQIKSSETDQQRELQERGKLIIKLENIIKAQQGEVSLASSKSKHLQIIFSQIITTVNKGIFVRKKELKETLSQISELME